MNLLRNYFYYLELRNKYEKRILIKGRLSLKLIRKVLDFRKRRMVDSFLFGKNLKIFVMIFCLLFLKNYVSLKKKC